ncbi:hypothetical protein K501DRAFT_265615 [Backusella circina FSU 941]|nr:hypothetical protein K501DRAFT_265615 [Backusella circina FSU 941]
MLIQAGNDTSIVDSYRTTNLETSTTQHVPKSVSTPNWTSKVQHREPGVIKLYSRGWWMTVYGSFNGIKNHIIVLGTFLIEIGLFLCTMDFRQYKPMLAVMGLLTFGLLGWIALANSLGGLELAIFICSWKYNFVIENLIGRSSCDLVIQTSNSEGGLWGHKEKASVVIY